MKRAVDAARETGIDAVIAMDPAVLLYAREKEMPVHISTQYNITNIEAVQFYAPYAEAMVLSRELTLGQVGNICQQIRKMGIKGTRRKGSAHRGICPWRPVYGGFRKMLPQPAHP